MQRPSQPAKQTRVVPVQTKLTPEQQQELLRQEAAQKDIESQQPDKDQEAADARWEAEQDHVDATMPWCLSARTARQFACIGIPILLVVLFLATYVTVASYLGFMYGDCCTCPPTPDECCCNKLHQAAESILDRLDELDDNFTLPESCLVLQSVLDYAIGPQPISSECPKRMQSLLDANWLCKPSRRMNKAIVGNSTCCF